MHETYFKSENHTVFYITVEKVIVMPIIEIPIRRENCSTRWDWEQQAQQQQDQSEGVSSSSYTSSPNVSSGSYGSSAQNASSSYGSSSDCQSAATTAQLAGDLCRWGGYNVMMWMIY